MIDEGPTEARQLTKRRALWLALGAVLSAAILLFFHDRSWWPPDDGAYAHVAERILDGEVLNRDVHDIHGGYVNLSNAAAMSVFGRSMLSLRYPLVLMGILQALIIQVLFLRFGGWSLIAPIAMTAFSTVQFLNPTAHWYALFLFCALVYQLEKQPKGFLTIGLLLGLIFWFRQLTGVLVSIGVVTNLILISRPQYATDCERSLLIQRSVCLGMAVGLLAYFLKCVRLDGAVAYGTAPLLLIGIAAVSGRIYNAEFARMTLRLWLGFFAATTPLLGYHLANGSVTSWLHETVLHSASLTGLDFIARQSFAYIVTSAAEVLHAPGIFADRSSALLWISLPLLPVVLGVALAARLFRRRKVSSLAVLSTFYAVVAVHYQISIYLWYVIAPVILSVLFLVYERHRALKWLSTLATAIAIAAALNCHAGQPPRPVRALVRGQVVDQYTVGDTKLLSRCGLRISLTDKSRLLRVLKLIDEHTTEAESILALPVNPEFYFLSQRRNPIPYFNAAIGVASPEGYQRAIGCIEEDPPRLVFVDRSDKYMTGAVEELWAGIQPEYEELTDLGDLTVFIRRTSEQASKD